MLETATRREKAQGVYESQLGWYEKTTRHACRWYRWLNIFIIIIVALMPIVIILTDSKAIQAVLPALVLICYGFLALWQFHEQRIRGAKAIHDLRIELLLFETMSGPYLGLSEEDAVSLFVANMSKVFQHEFSGWGKWIHKAPRRVEETVPEHQAGEGGPHV